MLNNVFVIGLSIRISIGLCEVSYKRKIVLSALFREKGKCLVRAQAREIVEEIESG